MRTFALILVVWGCGDDASDPPRAAGTWDVARNPRTDNCGMQVRGNVEWSIDDNLVLDIGRHELFGEADGDAHTFRFTEAVDVGGCKVDGELTVTFDLSADDNTFAGDLRGYLRYDPANRCGAAALNGPIRCDMDVGVTGVRTAE